MAGFFNLSLHEHFDESIQVTSISPTNLHLQQGTLIPRIQALNDATAFELPMIASRMSPVFDQGALGSCVANALVSAFDQIDDSPIGSRLFCQQNARKISGNVSRDSGTTIFAGISALTQSGLCQESTWPQTISKFTKAPPSNAQTQAKTNRVIQAFKIEPNDQSIKQWIRAGYPVTVGIRVYTSFMSAQVAKTGDVGLPLRTESFLGGHALLIVGFSDSTQKFKVRNSWGPSWGQSGQCTIPQSYFNRANLASDFWVITKTV